MSKFSSFLTNLDMIGKYPKFFIANNEIYKTPIGGFISIFIRLALLFNLIMIISEIFFLKRGTINTEDNISSQLPIYNISLNNHLYYFLIFTNDSLAVQNLDLSKVDIKLYNFRTYYSENQLKRDVYKQFNITICPQSIFQQAEISIYLKTKKLELEKQIYCFDTKDNDIRVGGDFIYGDETYQAYIYIGPKCQIENQCTNEEINTYFLYSSINATNLLFFNGYNNPNPFDYYNPVKRVFEHKFISLNNRSQSVMLEYSLSDMTLYDSVFPFVGGEKKKFLTFSNTYSYENKNNYYGFKISINHKIKIISRFYTTVDYIIFKFFSIFLSCKYAGTILLEVLHTYNIERFLINSTLINENSIFKTSNTVERNRDSININKDIIEKKNNIEEFSLPNTNLKLNEKILNKEDSQESKSKSFDNNSILSKSINITNCENKLDYFKQITKKISNTKIKINLKTRYFCFRKKSTNFINYFDSIKSILDITNYIKLYLQFEKLKRIVLSQNEKFLFETFNVDLKFINEGVCNRNINDLKEEDLIKLSNALEDIKKDQSSNYSRKIYEEINKEIRNNI